MKSDIFVENSLIAVYMKCESMDDVCKMREHFKMWSLGLPNLEDVPCMGMVRKLLNNMIGCGEKVYSEMMLLLFVFCQFVAMQVWWMMACTASESVAMADKGNRCEQTPGLK